MAEPQRSVLGIVAAAIIFVVVLIILFELIYSVKFVRTAGLVFAALIKTKVPLIGMALEAVIKTFIWF